MLRHDNQSADRQGYPVMASKGAPPVLTVQPSLVDDEGSPLRLVVFGDPGVGKTTLALSFPRPFIINTDEGLEGDALRMLRDRKGFQHSPEGHKDLEALYFFIRDHAEHFDTIVIDSLDGITELLLDEIVDEGKGMRTAKTIGQSVTDFVPEQAEYLANQRQMRTFLTDIRRLGKIIVLTSAIREPKEAGDKKTVDVSPGLQRIVNRWASVMGELTVVSLDPDNPRVKSRVLVTDPGSARSVNKTRYAALLPYVIEPTYDKIASVIAADREAYEASASTQGE